MKRPWVKLQQNNMLLVHLRQAQEDDDEEGWGAHMYESKEASVPIISEFVLA